VALMSRNSTNGLMMRIAPGYTAFAAFVRTLRQDLAAVRNAISEIIVTAGAAVPGPLAVQRAPPLGASAGSS
jgi:hypothetical protein